MKNSCHSQRELVTHKVRNRRVGEANVLHLMSERGDKMMHSGALQSTKRGASHTQLPRHGFWRGAREKATIYMRAH